MPVVPLADARDPARFGAKTATLAERAARYRVPPGFAVSADAAEDEIRAAVPSAYAALKREGHALADADVAVAVRSSAVGEDSRDASFAGQHDTLLDVRGADRVIDAIFAVRASATSERATAYRREKGIAETPRVGVLVQRMVAADVSVIAFTADPVTGGSDIVVIDACRGLGDAMASGEVTPDAITVRKSDLVVTGGDGVLTADRAREVARLALALESDAGHPVDIEAAFAGGTLYLLQSRPITSAGTSADDFPIEWERPGDEKVTWFREDAHFAGAALPLAEDYTRLGPGTGLERRSIKLGAPAIINFRTFNGYIYQGSRPVMPPDEAKRRTEEILGGRLARARQLARDWPERLLPAVRAHNEWIRAQDPSAMSGEDAARSWEEVWSRVSDIWEIHMTTTAGAYGVMSELGFTYQRLTGRPPDEAFTLTHGRAHTLQQLQRDMFTLSETARSAPSVADAIRGGVEELEVLGDLPGGATFIAAVETFLERHGDVGQPDEFIDRPAWGDHPALLIREVRRALEVPPSDPRARLAQLIASSDELAARVRTELGDRPSDLARFNDMLDLARAAGPLTEEHNYWIDRITQAIVRRVALRFAARLVSEGTIERPEDVFHLHVVDVAAALRRPRDLRRLVREREAQHLRNKRRRPPAFVGPPPTAPGGTLPGLVPRSELGYKEKQDDPNVLKGVAASAGIGRGPARLVREPADLDRVRAGDVLVCRSTHVSYVPVFGKVAAVVTEVGGSLSHAAVVAREFGVPAVVATGVALTVLRDGEDIEVDGSAGVVRRVAERVIA
jgi:pyruvate,water dikinase